MVALKYSMKAKTISVAQILLGAEVAAPDHLLGEDYEPDFDLVHPRGMWWGVVEHHRAYHLSRERNAARESMDARMPRSPFTPRSLCTPLSAAANGAPFLGFMGVELIDDDVIDAVAGMVRNQRGDETAEILFGAGLPAVGVDAAHGHAQCRAQGLCPVALVLELPCERLARRQRQVGGDALQGLNAGHLINRERDLLARRCLSMSDTPRRSPRCVPLCVDPPWHSTNNGCGAAVGSFF